MLSYVIAGMGITLRSIVMTGDPGLAVDAAHQRQEELLKEVIDHFPTMLRLSSADSSSGRSAGCTARVDTTYAGHREATTREPLPGLPGL